ncbi:hypothetical protein AAF712_003437 [Marasmius tenuissimus]|uniref:Bulb-type lectin domain-containing protein n=1 Tax=Marasmius tenuissimus TaxID=585030 RepID=A0ABR3A7R4_9AGAR|nr:hypothetical protein PM082_003901 [Marasmius tenuissimus]
MAEVEITLRATDITYPFGDSLPENGILGRGCGLKSQDNLVSFSLTWMGNLVLINEVNGELLWSLRNKGIAYVIMQTDGDCVAYTSDRKAVWATASNGGAHPYRLVCQNDGNLVVYGSQPYWASQTADKLMKSRLPRRIADESRQWEASAEILELFAGKDLTNDDPTKKGPDASVEEVLNGTETPEKVTEIV